jgi:hypothetical protein
VRETIVDSLDLEDQAKRLDLLLAGVERGQAQSKSLFPPKSILYQLPQALDPGQNLWYYISVPAKPTNDAPSKAGILFSCPQIRF